MNEVLLRTECTFFFQNNPYALETAYSLATRLGRNHAHLEPILQQLVVLSILVQVGAGDHAVYRYNKPDKTVVT